MQSGPNLCCLIFNKPPYCVCGGHTSSALLGQLVTNEFTHTVYVEAIFSALKSHPVRNMRIFTHHDNELNIYLRPTHFLGKGTVIATRSIWQRKTRVLWPRRRNIMYSALHYFIFRLTLRAEALHNGQPRNGKLWCLWAPIHPYWTLEQTRASHFSRGSNVPLFCSMKRAKRKKSHQRSVQRMAITQMRHQQLA